MFSGNFGRNFEVGVEVAIVNSERGRYDGTDIDVVAKFVLEKTEG